MKKFFLCLILLVSISAYQAFCGSQDIDLVIDPKIAWQGKVLTVKVLSAEGIAEVKASFLGQDFKCYRSGDDFQGVVGVPINQKTGYYNLKLIVTREDGNVEEITKKMKVWATRFPYSRFWLKPSKKKLMTRKLINKEWAQIEKTLIVENSVQRWEGRFSRPVEGRVSQGFGHRQIINGKNSGNHRGVDIAVFNGTEIKAPNRGKVVFKERLKAFGGTLILDHGQGIHTLYFHMSKVIPEVGEEIEKGELIGLSGNSGISSGPHLHWGMSVHNLRIDPMQWVKYEI